MVKAGTFLVFCTIFFLKTSAGNYIELLYVDFALLNWKFHGLLIPLLPLPKPCTRCMSSYSTFVKAETSGLRIEQLWWCQLTALALNLMKTAACLMQLWFWINQWFYQTVFISKLPLRTHCWHFAIALPLFIALGRNVSVFPISCTKI